MSLQRETISLEEAVADLEDEKEELADKVAQIPPDDRTAENQDYLQYSRQAGEIERYLGGLDWVRNGPENPDAWNGTPIPDDGFGNDVEFTLSGLSTAETLEVSDRSADLRSEAITPTKSTNNIETVFWVAKGLEDAPFIDAGADYDATCRAVRGLPRQLTDWIESRINDLSTVGNRNGSNFEQLVEEKTETYHQTSS